MNDPLYDQRDNQSAQDPDPRPGYYYVSVRRYTPRAEYRLLRGPFVNDHAAALTAVDETMRRSTDLDPRGCWYAYGTCRSEIDLGPGLFDKLDAELSNGDSRRER